MWRKAAGGGRGITTVNWHLLTKRVSSDLHECLAYRLTLVTAAGKIESMFLVSTFLRFYCKPSSGQGQVG